jgi:type IV secretory pathway VirB3-like protein
LDYTSIVKGITLDYTSIVKGITLDYTSIVKGITSLIFMIIDEILYHMVQIETIIITYNNRLDVGNMSSWNH